MKTNVIFKFLAIVVAIGGAITSIQASGSFSTEQPHVKYTNGGNTFCTTVSSSQCTTAVSSDPCNIQVQIESQGTTTARSWNHGCTAIQYNSTSTTVGSKVIPFGSVVINN